MPKTNKGKGRKKDLYEASSTQSPPANEVKQPVDPQDTSQAPDKLELTNVGQKASSSGKFFHKSEKPRFDVDQLIQVAGDHYHIVVSDGRGVDQQQKSMTSVIPPLDPSSGSHFAALAGSSTSESITTTHESNRAIVYSSRPGNMIYHDQLLTKKHGIPLWIPEPNRRLSMAYRRRGVSIGDVGVFLPSGAFSFIFNICAPSNDPVNPPTLPDGFTPIELGRYDISEYMDFTRGSYLSSTSIERVQDGESLSQGLSFQTSTQISSTTEGAVLTLPDGAISFDLRNYARFLTYLQDHLVNWYQYVREVCGIPVENGKLHLVTGCDKTSTCGMAVLSNISRHSVHHLRFRSTQQGVVTLPSSSQSSSTLDYYWECTGLSESRVDPDPNAVEELQRNDDSGISTRGTYSNHSIFLRTMNARLKDEIFTAICHKYESGSSHVQGTSEYSGDTAKQADTHAGNQNGMKGDVNTIESVASFPSLASFHPSYHLNKVLLKKAGSSTRMAVMQDIHWYSVLEENNDEMPSSDELENRVLANHIIREGDGIIYLEPTEEHLTKMKQRFPNIIVEPLSEQAHNIYSRIIREGDGASMDLLTHDPNLYELEPTEEHLTKMKQRVPNIILEPLSEQARQVTRQNHHYSGNNTNSAYNSYNSAPSLAPAPSQNGRYSRIFALIIAINVYKNPLYDPLRGCVADADAIERFLVSDLGIDSQRIRRLRDAQATRANIIREFERLSVPSRQNSIHSGDPIIIYYAGYGAEIKPPDGWPEDKNIQMIIPHDCEQRVSTQSTQVIHGIPDVTIQALLNKIADAKGDNITVIFDNCYSGSGTRDTSDTEPYISRAVSYHNRASFVPTLDGYPFPLNTFDSIHSGHDSHVLLAACNSREKAGEIHGQGLFTKALLEAMRMPDIRNVTYKELLMKLARLPKDQNPQCEGRNQDRLLFTTQVCSRPFNTTFDAKVSAQRTLLIAAGLSHWINEGDILNYWSRDDDPLTAAPRGTATVSQVKYSNSYAKTSNEVPRDALIVAQLYRSSGRTNLLLHIPSSGQMRIVKNAIAQFSLTATRYRAKLELVDQKENARLVIDREGAEYKFRYNDPLASRYGLSDLRHKAPANTDMDTFQVIFDKLTAYEYYLRHREEAIINKVSLGVHRIRPTGELDSEDLNIHGTGLDLSYGGSFAIKIHNQMERDLYPALFYFDSFDFSIRSIYTPPFAGYHAVDFPLKARTTLTLGHGSEGAPFFVDVRDPERSECGYIKLFISTTQVDFSGIKQGSVFARTRTVVPYQRKEAQFFWSLVVPFVVRSKAPSSLTIRSGPNVTRSHSNYSTRSAPTIPPPNYEDVVNQLQNLDVSGRYLGPTNTSNSTSGQSRYHNTYNDSTADGSRNYPGRDRSSTSGTSRGVAQTSDMGNHLSNYSAQPPRETVLPPNEQYYPPQAIRAHERSTSNTTTSAYQSPPIQHSESYYQTSTRPPYPANEGPPIVPMPQRPYPYAPRSATLEPQTSQSFYGNNSSGGTSPRHNPPSRSTTFGTQPYPSPPWPTPAYGHQESLYTEESQYRTTPPLLPTFPVPSHQGTLENFSYIPTMADEEGEHVQYGGGWILPDERRRY